jgi:hypothetical protein
MIGGGGRRRGEAGKEAAGAAAGKDWFLNYFDYYFINYILLFN